MALLPARGHFRTVYNCAPSSLTSLNAPIQTELYEWLRTGTLTSSSNVAPLRSDCPWKASQITLVWARLTLSRLCVFVTPVPTPMCAACYDFIPFSSCKDLKTNNGIVKPGSARGLSSRRGGFILSGLLLYLFFSICC